MIIEYHRPRTMDEAFRLLSRPEILTLVLAGGTVLTQNGVSRRLPWLKDNEAFAVVDIQNLGLNSIFTDGKNMKIGAGVKLDQLQHESGLPDALQEALSHEGTKNIRQAATIAGSLVTTDGRSPLATVLLAMDAEIMISEADGKMETCSIGNWLPLRVEKIKRRIITGLVINHQIKTAYAYSARTPFDRPIVCAAIARWPSGRTRLALGGYGLLPVLVLDGPEPGGLEMAARQAYVSANDDWATGDYRSAVAGELAQRCFDKVS